MYVTLDDTNLFFLKIDSKLNCESLSEIIGRLVLIVGDVVEQFEGFGSQKFVMRLG